MKVTPTFEEMHEKYKEGNDQLRKRYKEELKGIVLKQSEDKLALAEIFLNIAGTTLEIAEAAIPELKLYYYNDVATTCHYVLKIAKEEKAEPFRVLEQSAFSYLNDVQTSIVELCGNGQNQLPKIEGKNAIDFVSNKKELQALRDSTRESLKKTEETYKDTKNEEHYINESAALFKTIASKMEHYLAELYKTAEGILGEAPCKYAVIGLGSMALRQMTPYSDLECAILTENKKYKEAPDLKVKDYFKNLSHLVNFMIINLGETIIPTSRFDLDLSKFIPQAVNFDLGGKTPLGRIEQDKPYDLVQTVEEMLRDLRNEKHRSEHMDKNLPNILQKSCFVYGKPELQKEYQEEADAFLKEELEDKRSNGEVRAVRVLLEGVVEKDYTASPSTSKQIEGALQQFSPDLTNSKGRLFDVKQEIYRLPDRLIYNLGLIYGIQEESSWDTLDKLCEFGKISPEGTQNLKKALTFATNLRLKTYDHYGYQKETMDFSKAYNKDISEAEKLKKALSQTFQLDSDDLKPDGALFEYYKIIAPLHKKLRDFCEGKNLGNKDTFLIHEECYSNNFGTITKIHYEKFYSNSFGTMAKIHLRLLQYREALNQYLLELEELKAQFGIEHPSVATNLTSIGYTYVHLGKHELALQYYLDALELSKKLFGQEYPDVAIALGNVGYTYGYLGKHELALQYQLEALELSKKLFGEGHSDVAAILNNVGITYYGQGKYELALQYHLEALELRKKLLGETHPYVAISLDNVGTVYSHLNKHELALQYHLEALELSKKLLGEEHPDVAISIDNVGGTYCHLRRYTLALKYRLKALELNKKLLGEEHPDVAISLGNVGDIYNSLGQYALAIQYQLEALKLSEKLFGQEHPHTTATISTVGIIYGNLGQHKLALQHHLKALELRKKLLGEEHTDVAASLNNVGGTYNYLGKHELALLCHLKALELRKKLLGEEHTDVAASLNNVGATYGDLGKHELALQYKLEALEQYKKLVGEEHSSVVISLNSVGITYGHLGRPALTLQYHLEALELSKKLFSKEHIHVAESLYYIGLTYGNLGQYKLALQYHLEALELRKKLLGEEHPDTLMSKYNVGYVYPALGEYDKALTELEETLVKAKETGQQKQVAQCQKRIEDYKSYKSKYNQALKILEEREEQLIKIANKSKSAARPLCNNAISSFEKAVELLGSLPKAFAENQKLKALDLLVTAYKGSGNKHYNKKLMSATDEHTKLSTAIKDKEDKFKKIEEYLATKVPQEEEQEFKDLAVVSLNTSQKSNIVVDPAALEQIPLMTSLDNKLQESVELNNSNQSTLINTGKLDTAWYDSLVIRDSLVKKGVNQENILAPASTDWELCKRLNEINKPNYSYMIPLNVDARDGSFTASNHWVGLYVCTDKGRKITEIKYLNPIGQPINKKLNNAITQQTGIIPEDTTEGKGVQFAYIKETGIELKGNINDCGPFLVQLFYELGAYGEIRTKSLNEKESIAFGQQCRKEQSYKKDNTLEEGNLSTGTKQENIVTSVSFELDMDKFLSKGLMDIRDQYTTFILHKKEDEVIIRWFDFTNFAGTTNGKILLEVLASKASDLGITVIAGNNACLNLLNQACYKATKTNLPTDWFVNFLEYIELAGVTGQPDSESF